MTSTLIQLHVKARRLTSLLRSQVEEQPPLWTVLSVPTSDQLDDWQDYLRMLVAEFGLEAAGPTISHLGSDVLASNTGTASFDSGYQTLSRLSSNDEASSLRPDPHSIASRNALSSSLPTDLKAEKKVKEGTETDEPAEEELVQKPEKSTSEMAAAATEPGRKKEGLQMKASLGQRRGTVLVSDVVAGGEITKREKGKAGEGNGFLRLGRKLGL